jgi:hypothetical protein
MPKRKRDQIWFRAQAVTALSTPPQQQLQIVAAGFLLIADPVHSEDDLA